MAKLANQYKILDDNILMIINLSTGVVSAVTGLLSAVTGVLSVVTGL